MVLSAVSDLFDGYFARKLGVASRLGTYADRLTDFDMGPTNGMDQAARGAKSFGRKPAGTFKRKISPCIRATPIPCATAARSISWLLSTAAKTP